MTTRPIPLPQLHREITRALLEVRHARLDGRAASISMAGRKLDFLLDELSARLRAAVSTVSEVQRG